MRKTAKIDHIDPERIPMLVHDMRTFMSSDRERLMGMLESRFCGRQTVDFYRGLVTASDYAAGMVRQENPEITKAYINFFGVSAMSAYVLDRVMAGERQDFKGTDTNLLDAPLTGERLEGLVPPDCLYDYSELFLGDKSPDFYQGLVKGYDEATGLAQSCIRNSNAHVQLDLITMFIAYKIREMQGKKIDVEILSPHEYKIAVTTDGLIGYELR